MFWIGTFSFPLTRSTPSSCRTRPGRRLLRIRPKRSLPSTSSHQNKWYLNQLYFNQKSKKSKSKMSFMLQHLNNGWQVTIKKLFIDIIFFMCEATSANYFKMTLYNSFARQLSLPRDLAYNLSLLICFWSALFFFLLSVVLTIHL